MTPEEDKPHKGGICPDLVLPPRRSLRNERRSRELWQHAALSGDSRACPKTVRITRVRRAMGVCRRAPRGSGELLPPVPGGTPIAQGGCHRAAEAASAQSSRPVRGSKAVKKSRPP